jgi:hypothetical protein
VSTGFSNEPGSLEPGLDHLIRALTADGHPHELAGRDAALAAFRAAAHGQPRRQPRFTPWLSGSRRLTTVAAALVAGIAGFTAAAYAQALPAPVQRIAYSVLSPFGVPDNPPSTSPARSGTAPGSAPGSVAAGGHGTASPSASCPCPTATSSQAVAGSVLVISVGRTRLQAGGSDAIAGNLTRHGQPESGVRVRLLEQPAGSPGWQLVASGVTGGRGKVRFGVVRLTQNAAFRLATPGGGAGSAPVSVTVIPHVGLVLVPGAATDRFVASARFGDPGDTVVLQESSGGTWQDLATGTLGALHHAVFVVPPGAVGTNYRVVLRATSNHGRGISAPVRQTRAHSRIGAKVIVPGTAQPSPTATVTSQTTTPPPNQPTPTPGQPTPTPPAPAATGGAGGV